MADQEQLSPDEAFAEAERRVKEARETDDTSLDLGIANLERIPSLQGLTALNTLGLNGTRVSDLTPLSALNGLIELRLGSTQVSDLTPLGGLNLLRVLYADYTHVSDLSPLGHLTELRVLYLFGAQVSDLSPLAGHAALHSIILDRTQVSDLAPLAGLTELSALFLSGTEVSDLTPLQGLTTLKTLVLDETKVSDLAPLRNLTALTRLNFTDTQVSDLSTVAAFVSLIDGARRNPETSGLHFYGCPLADMQLLALAALENPERTIRTINYLREQQRLPLINDDRVVDRGNGKDNEIVPPPKLPTQSVGPHYAVRADGVVGFASPEALDREGNNVPRLRSLHEQLKQAARDLVNGLAPRANQHPRVLENARKYLTLIEGELDGIDFARVYGFGLRLELAAEAAKREIGDRIAPSLEDDEYEALESLLLMHGPFILSSAQGRELLADAERYQMRRDDLPEIRKAAGEFGDSLKQRPDIATSEVAEDISESAEGIGEGPHGERPTTYTLDSVANLTVALGEIAIAAVVFGPGVFVTAATAWAVLRKQPEYREAFEIAEKVYADLHKAGVDGLKNTVPRFLLDNQAPLRRLAARSRRLSFLIRLLDWLDDQAWDDK
jgi:Leucine-rich repeat (LRR) protein